MGIPKIDVINRTKCQYCRYIKCISIGMIPNLIELNTKNDSDDVIFLMQNQLLTIMNVVFALFHLMNHRNLVWRVKNSLDDQIII